LALAGHLIMNLRRINLGDALLKIIACCALRYGWREPEW
jgi:hypothetical protein